MARLHVIVPSVAMAQCLECGANFSDAGDLTKALRLHVVSGPHVREEWLWFRIYVLTQTTLDFHLECRFVSSPRRLVGNIKMTRGVGITMHDLAYEVHSSYTENLPMATT